MASTFRPNSKDNYWNIWSFVTTIHLRVKLQAQLITNGMKKLIDVKTNARLKQKLITKNENKMSGGDALKFIDPFDFDQSRNNPIFRYLENVKRKKNVSIHFAGNAKAINLRVGKKKKSHLLVVPDGSDFGSKRKRREKSTPRHSATCSASCLSYPRRKMKKKEEKNRNEKRRRGVPLVEVPQARGSREKLRNQSAAPSLLWRGSITQPLTFVCLWLTKKDTRDADNSRPARPSVDLRHGFSYFALNFNRIVHRFRSNSQVCVCHDLTSKVSRSPNWIAKSADLTFRWKFTCTNWQFRSIVNFAIILNIQTLIWLFFAFNNNERLFDR